MKFLTRIAILFYVSLALFLGCFTVLYVLNLIDFKPVFDVLFAVYYDKSLRTIVASTAWFVLVMNFIFYRVFTVTTYREKIIAFDNPAGRVSVALVALEDLIRRTISRLPEVKEGRVDIRASKKGLRVRIRLVLCSEVNIPEITSTVQETVKRKIQDIIGLDEPINITVYIGKILPERVKEKRAGKSPEREELPEPAVPFQGYRA